MREIEFTAPVRIESEMNRREHWSVRARRFRGQRLAIVSAWNGYWRGKGPRSLATREIAALLNGGVIVTMVRIAPKRITDEHENLRCGFKAVVDQLAKEIGMDDGDPRIEWRYAQRKGGPREYSIHVKIEAAPLTTA